MKKQFILADETMHVLKLENMNKELGSAASAAAGGRISKVWRVNDAWLTRASSPAPPTQTRCVSIFLFYSVIFPKDASLSYRISD